MAVGFYKNLIFVDLMGWKLKRLQMTKKRQGHQSSIGVKDDLVDGNLSDAIWFIEIKSDFTAYVILFRVIWLLVKVIQCLPMMVYKYTLSISTMKTTKSEAPCYALLNYWQCLGIYFVCFVCLITVFDFVYELIFHFNMCKWW